MLKFARFYILFVLIGGCRQAYEPPAIKAPNHYLVVDGVINTAPDSKTTITLTKSANLSDSVVYNPEASASVQIEGQSGAVYGLAEQGEGVYVADHLTLNANDQYRLHIRTRDGGEYRSDFVPVKRTPPIDELTWKQDGDLTIYVSTHDPQNQTRYYRWDFLETWQYQSFLMSNYGLGVSNGTIFILDQNTQKSNCWMTLSSTEINIATSAKLSQDVIDHFPIATIPKNSDKIGIRYSTLVRQYALTEEAYKYWEILQKNTQSLGTILDAQPGQLIGNLHNMANPAEPVIGFVSACDIQELRLFINNRDLFNWTPEVPSPVCSEQVISQNPSNPFLWDYPDTTYEPWYFVSPGGIRIAKKDCLDCRRKGGTNQKPLFW